MTQEKVDMWVVNNSKYIPADKLMYVKEKLTAMDDSRYAVVTSIEFKDPTVMLILSIFLGGFGIDRFLLGNVGMGILKLLTGGVCGIVWLIDIFNVQKKTRDLNFNNLMTLI